MHTISVTFAQKSLKNQFWFFILPIYFPFLLDIYYDPLMMSQKESPRKHTWVLPRKVAKMIWISVQFSFVEYDGCFLLCTRSSRRKHPGSTHNYLLMTGNLHQIGYFSGKHPWVIPGCFLQWHHQRVIVYNTNLSNLA